MFERCQKYNEMMNMLEKHKRFTLALIKLIEHSRHFEDFDQRKLNLKNKIVKNI